MLVSEYDELCCYGISSRRAPTSQGRAAGSPRSVHLATLLRALAPEEVEIAIGFLSGEPRQGTDGARPFVDLAGEADGSG
jgi:hypothetical protein